MSVRLWSAPHNNLLAKYFSKYIIPSSILSTRRGGDRLITFPGTQPASHNINYRAFEHWKPSINIVLYTRALKGSILVAIVSYVNVYTNASKIEPRSLVIVITHTLLFRIRVPE